MACRSDSPRTGLGVFTLPFPPFDAGVRGVGKVVSGTISGVRVGWSWRGMRETDP